MILCWERGAGQEHRSGKAPGIRYRNTQFLVSGGQRRNARWPVDTKESAKSGHFSRMWYPGGGGSNRAGICHAPPADPLREARWVDPAVGDPASTTRPAARDVAPLGGLPRRPPRWSTTSLTPVTGVLDRQAPKVETLLRGSAEDLLSSPPSRVSRPTRLKSARGAPNRARRNQDVLLSAGAARPTPSTEAARRGQLAARD